MILLTIPEFISNKRRDKLVVFGCGYSINAVGETQWKAIDEEYDTLGMNWFCKKKRPTTWYLVREQCATPKRIETGHTLEDFVELMEQYVSSVKIVKDMEYRTNNYQHARNLHLFDGPGRVFGEIQGGCSPKSFCRDDIFTDGIHHGKGTIYDALHFAVGMHYTEVLFCGIDLYDNRYFYLPRDETLQQTMNEGQSVDAPHLMADKTLRVVGDFAKTYPDIALSVQNKRSLLAEIIPVWGRP